ncbi:GntR family transcriptional regulator [Rhodococcus sp. NPDC127530]|uniref:GntR family transcriptional regulator n=1 Tax=unclassified Rhodococcus (in: high G+C Gram-positive bacteria) TaxID=192944 RepID=UPI003625220F
MTELAGQSWGEISPVSTVEALAKELTLQILSPKGTGELKLRESVVAQHYGVARHTVRAAMGQLTARGILTHTANKGWRVPQFTDQDFQDIMFLRTALEVQALREVARRNAGIGATASRALERIRLCTTKTTWAERMENDMTFHRGLVDEADSPRLSRAYRDLQDVLHLALIQRESWLEPETLETWQELHVRMATTIEHGDPCEVEAMLRQTFDYPLHPGASADALDVL